MDFFLHLWWSKHGYELIPFHTKWKFWQSFCVAADVVSIMQVELGTTSWTLRVLIHHCRSCTVAVEMHFAQLCPETLIVSDELTWRKWWRYWGTKEHTALGMESYTRGTHSCISNTHFVCCDLFCTIWTFFLSWVCSLSLWWKLSKPKKWVVGKKKAGYDLFYWEIIPSAGVHSTARVVHQ